MNESNQKKSVLSLLTPKEKFKIGLVPLIVAIFLFIYPLYSSNRDKDLKNAEGIVVDYEQENVQFYEKIEFEVEGEKCTCFIEKAYKEMDNIGAEVHIAYNTKDYSQCELYRENNLVLFYVLSGIIFGVGLVFVYSGIKDIRKKDQYTGQ